MSFFYSLILNNKWVQYVLGSIVILTVGLVIYFNWKHGVEDAARLEVRMEVELEKNKELMELTEKLQKISDEFKKTVEINLNNIQSAKQFTRTVYVKIRDIPDSNINCPKTKQVLSEIYDKQYE